MRNIMSALHTLYARLFKKKKENHNIYYINSEENSIFQKLKDLYQHNKDDYNNKINYIDDINVYFIESKKDDFSLVIFRGKYASSKKFCKKYIRRIKYNFKILLNFTVLFVNKIPYNIKIIKTPFICNRQYLFYNN